MERLAGLLERHPRAAGRLFTARELAHAEGRMRIHRLAGKFAAKEAVLKALRTGAAKGLWFDQVEVLPDGAGAPVVNLHGAARERARALGAGGVLLSISHERDMATATAILVSRSAGAGPDI